MDDTMTVYDLVKATVRMMEEIAVPIGMMDSIGAPIRASVNNLKACLGAWDRDNAEKAAKEQEVAEHDQAE